MDDWVRKELDDRITKLERETVRLRKGAVTDIDPLSVALGGADTADAIVGLSAIDGLALAVDDVVTVLARGNDMLVVGRAGRGTVRGVVAANGTVVRGAGFSSARTPGYPAGVYTVTLDVPFDVGPVISVTPLTGNADIGRAYSDTPGTLGFAFERSTTGALVDPSVGFHFIAMPA